MTVLLRRLHSPTALMIFSQKKKAMSATMTTNPFQTTSECNSRLSSFPPPKIRNGN